MKSADVIDYARDRGIRVVPEFDMPGHSTAWFVGYPELASGQGPYQSNANGAYSIRRWIPPTRRPTSSSTPSIGEMAKLFPDPYFHIGGDEVNGKEWDANPKIQEFMKSHNIKRTSNCKRTSASASKSWSPSTARRRRLG